ncbi:MAG: hypothetical protein IH596_14735 [Bacteroidales bacterium]|nr:hypothetical protein [Bacteroidales bacterium]
MHEKWVIGIHITDRVHDSIKVQHTLTKFGCSIRTRFGINEDKDFGTSGHGLVLLELTGEQSEFVKLMKELRKIEGIEVKKMVFTH